MFRKAKKAWSVLLREGPWLFWAKSREKIESGMFDAAYRRWVKRYHSLNDDDLRSLSRAARDLKRRPLISILMPVYNTEERFLREAIESVIGQIYDNWELCIADDASSKPYILPLLHEYSERESRIKLIHREVNGHISAASNSALELVTGEYTALMDHDDKLHPAALYFVANEINEQPQAKLIYSDEDKIDEGGKLFQPSLKPDWSPELLYSLNLVTHLIVYKTENLKRSGGFRTGFEGSQDFDLALRIAADLQEEEVVHIPRVLYHWRAASGSVALSSEEKPYAHDRARTAISEVFAKRRIPAQAVKGHGELHRLKFHFGPAKPRIALIVFGKALNPRILEQQPNNFDLSVAQTASRNYSALNDAAKMSDCQFLCFLDGGSKSVSGAWLDDMVGYASLPGIGAVGPKILDDRGRIKHAGFILGIRKGIGRPYKGDRSDKSGNFYYLVATRNVSAISIDCLMITRQAWQKASGFDSETFEDLYGDIDLCLRLRKLGYRNLWTPWAEIVQEDEILHDDEKAIEMLKKRHPEAFARDPYYNQNFSSEREFALAEPPRIGKI